MFRESEPSWPYPTIFPFPLVLGKSFYATSALRLENDPGGTVRYQLWGLEVEA